MNDPFLLILIGAALLTVAAFALALRDWDKPDKRIHPDYVSIPRTPSFVAFPAGTRHSHSTDEHPWRHPYGYPYQVYDGHMASDKAKQVWVATSKLDGYKLIEDHYSDRLYFVPQEDPHDHA